MAEAIKTESLTTLEGEQFISLTSYRKNGNEVSTPVWFAEENGKLYITTNVDAWKVKRIRNNSHVKMKPCDARGATHGETVNGMATIHDAATTTGEKANQALSNKYGLMKRFFDFLAWIQRSPRLYIEVTVQ